MAQLCDGTSAPVRAHLGTPGWPTLEDGHVGAVHADLEPDLVVVLCRDAVLDPSSDPRKVKITWLRSGRQGPPSYERGRLSAAVEFYQSFSTEWLRWTTGGNAGC